MFRWSQSDYTSVPFSFKVSNHKARANGLLITAHDADVGGSVTILPERVDSGDALPGGGSHESFTQDDFRREARPAPILPGGAFSRVKAPQLLGAIAEQITRVTSGQFGPKAIRGLCATLFLQEKMRIRDRVQLNE